MIIFIHGFGSSGFSFKAEKTQYYFKNKEVVLSPSLSYVPYLAINTLEQIIEYALPKESVYLIGSSLGGFYSMYLSNKYNIKAVLINPAVNAPITLGKYEGMATNYYDLSQFEWNNTHVSQLENLIVKNPKEDNLLLMLQKGDEVLDYKEALQKLPNASLIIEDGGDHSFNNYQKYLPTIEKFFNIK